MNPHITAVVICAWCQHIITPGGYPASHGMCDTCLEKQMAELDKTENKS